MKALTIGVTVHLSLLCVACLGDGPKERAGTLGGGAGGSTVARVAGASAPGIIGGALAGRLVGGSVGKSLDKRDEELALKAAEQSFERAAVGEPTAWRNPESGNSGSVTSTREFENDLGERCREYREVVTTGGQQQVVTGIACRGADGRWRE